MYSLKDMANLLPLRFLFFFWVFIIYDFISVTALGPDLATLHSSMLIENQ